MLEFILNQTGNGVDPTMYVKVRDLIARSFLLIDEKRIWRWRDGARGGTMQAHSYDGKFVSDAPFVRDEQ